MKENALVAIKIDSQNLKPFFLKARNVRTKHWKTKAFFHEEKSIRTSDHRQCGSCTIDLYTDELRFMNAKKCARHEES